MSHVYAYGVQCPKAKGIIHLGATSCYVGDNTDLIIMHEALELVQKKIVNVLEKLEEFALKYKDMPCLAFTHFQPAQPTTVGKRASLWAQDLYMDYVEIQHLLDNKKLLGCKGTTGTQASFMELFEGDTDKVKALDKKICEKLGYDQYFAVSGQTYTRKYDTQVLQVLVQIAQSAHKFSNDIRLLQHMKEIEEPLKNHKSVQAQWPTNVTLCVQKEWQHLRTTLLPIPSTLQLRLVHNGLKEHWMIPQTNVFQ